MDHRESFLVRIWFDSTCLPSQMRGEVQHVRSGQSRRFCGQEELLTILNDWIEVIREDYQGPVEVTLDEFHKNDPTYTRKEK